MSTTAIETVTDIAPDQSLAPSLLQGLVDIVRRPVSADIRPRVALHVLDWIGCAALGARSPSGLAMADYGSCLGLGPSHAIGVGKLEASAAAFINGAYGNVLEMDDIHRSSILHPGPVVIPAGLAVALREQCTGEDFLDALVRGYEAMIRIGRSVGPGHYRHWHNTSTCGPFGAAAAAGAVLELSSEQMLWALGNAGTQASGPWQCRLEGTMSKQLHTARAAQAGVTAAELARCGFTGPTWMLEGPLGFYAAMCPGPVPENVLADAAAPWLIEQTSFKPWPACRHTHAAIDALLSLRGNIEAAQVEAITVRTFGDAVGMCDNRSPLTTLEAKFSLQHCAAIVLLDGPPRLEGFEPAALHREDVVACRQKVTLQVAEPFASAYPNHFGASVSIRLVGGREVSAQADDALGDPENAMNAEAVEAKARMLMHAAGVARQQVEAIILAARALAQGGTPGELADLLP